jgi:hypothetical protein
MIITDKAYEPEGQMYRSTPIRVFVGERDESMEVLGVANGIDPVTGQPRKIWGLADRDRVHLSPMCYAITNLATPPLLLDSLRRSQTDRFTFHNGMPLWTTVDDLAEALGELGLVAPTRYKGVAVPPELINNWLELETSWWRRGVDAANMSMALKLHGLAEEIDAEGNRYE